MIGIYSYIPYFRDIFAGKTKPHAFTWFVWFLLTAIAFFAQIAGDGGPGAWVTGFTAAVSFVIFVVALKVGKHNIAPADWFFFIGSLASLGLWFITKDPVGSVILITIIDLLAFLPTFRKSWHKPHEETSITYMLSGIKFAISIAALSTITITTVLYPLSLVVTNIAFVAMLQWRRKQVKVGPPMPF
ncbi:MAG: hypothetical protein WBP26_04040 [Candidatus Saccharimonadales bacterium]